MKRFYINECIEPLFKKRTSLEVLTITRPIQATHDEKTTRKNR